MELMLFNGKLLVVGGQLAIDPSCCCGTGTGTGTPPDVPCTGCNLDSFTTASVSVTGATTGFNFSVSPLLGPNATNQCFTNQCIIPDPTYSVDCGWSWTGQATIGTTLFYFDLGIANYFNGTNHVWYGCFTRCLHSTHLNSVSWSSIIGGCSHGDPLAFTDVGIPFAGSTATFTLSP